MGKGKRAHFESYDPPISSSDLISAKLPLDADIQLPAAASPSPIPAVDPTEQLQSLRKRHRHEKEHILEGAPLAVLCATYLSYFILIVFGHIRDFFGKRFYPEEFSKWQNKNGLAAISSGFDTFYQRRIYFRIRDVFNRPVTNVPGGKITVLERVTHDGNKTFQLTGKSKEVLNLSSYNYLGFAQNEGPCADAVEACVRKNGISTSSPRMAAGTSDLHIQTEALVARFIGHEAALIVSMGFATNSTTIPALVGKGCLVVSDELNHSSLVYGSRLSGAAIRVFKHNDPEDLEAVLRDAISQGQPRTHRPWKKILVIVEGLYSMEGSICNLPDIVALKKKYKFYLYLDEAHSIGAMGPNGRGICDYFGLDPKDVDIMMGTFTKSFGSAGGYIAATKEIIDHLRLKQHSSIYGESVSIPVLQQICTSLKIISGEEGGDDGRRRIQVLARNARFFSTELKKMGFIVYGDTDSPVIPVLIFHPAKLAAFSRECLARGIAVVVVGYPATPIITSRVRFCISAAHTMEDLKFALNVVSELGDRMCLKVSRVKRGPDGEIVGKIGMSLF
ncbi:serine palmitoyltransferase component [Borealophlyctis nickersoniae]|nr:serine palmitoyltransferase component [Borealophlyctis nickersoniae]